MENQIIGQTEDASAPLEDDPWAAAFAALEQKGKGDAPSVPDAPAGEPGADAALPGEGEAVPGVDAAGDGSGDQEGPGGLGADAGVDGVQDRRDTGSLFEDAGGKELQQYREDLESSIREQAMNDIANEFRKRGVRNRNGKLGATMDDADICKRDEDGVPHFYNPETGQEFRGDNPRRQAQEWCDDYNRELARVYNEACEQYEKHLREEARPKLAVIEFKPKYDQLDDIRRGMFENVIEDYEVRDGSGKLVGYSCDLDKALALVDRQIAMIQGYAKAHRQQQPEVQPTGPALDMKASNGTMQAGQGRKIDSLAAAMESIQDRELEKFRNR